MLLAFAFPSHFFFHLHVFYPFFIFLVLTAMIVFAY